jgi:citrate lyase synthetase
MTEEEAKMYNTVRQWVVENPSSVGVITMALTAGLRDYADKANKVRMEWEVIACVAMEARLFKGHEKMLADKIDAMKDTNSLKWDHTVEVLRKKHAKRAALEGKDE